MSTEQAGGVVGNDHREHVEQLVGEYRRSRDQLAEVQRELMSITESATSPDGSVTATVGPHGTLVALTIADSAYQRHRPSALGKMVVRVTAEAAEKAAHRASGVLARVLPGDTDPSAVLAGRADLAPEEVAVTPPAGPARSDDDDSFEHRSWLDVSHQGWPA